jgi:hypothetical protein
MRIAPGLVVERVEDGEGGWPVLNGEPRDRSRLIIHQGHGRPQKISDLFLLPGFACRGTYNANLVITVSSSKCISRPSLDGIHAEIGADVLASSMATSAHFRSISANRG